MVDFRKDPEYIKQRREIIRRHHPDAGGAEADLIHALADLDDRWSSRALQRQRFEEMRPSFITDEQADQAFEQLQRVEELYSQAEQRINTARIKAQEKLQGSKMYAKATETAATTTSAVSNGAASLWRRTPKRLRDLPRQIQEEFKKGLRD